MAAVENPAAAALPPRGSTLIYAKSALILFTLGCFATEHLVHYPVALMALLGLLDAAIRPGALRESRVGHLLLLFALIWLPMLCAWPDAVAPERTTKTVLLYLHLLPAAYFVLRACCEAEVLRLVSLGAAVLVCFVAFDAFVQLIWHTDLFGYPYADGILKGVFYPKQRLGLFLAVFAPLAVDAILRWCRQYPQLWLFLIPLALAIVMSLKRSAWLMLAVGMAVYACLRWRQSARRIERRLLLRLTIVVIVAVSAAGVSTPVVHRMAETRGLFGGERADIDRASGYRLSLWQTGYRMFRANWLNGVGPRGYREAYATYAPDDDFWLARNGTGQTHPHLLVAEVAAETGVIGLLGFALSYCLIVRLLLLPTVGRTVPVWMIAAGLAWFPLNAHLAFYGSYWSTLAWLLLAIGLAASRLPATPRGG